jgi:transcriptional regulator with XRE-family HTH domain
MKNIKSKIEEKGITKKQVAKMVGINVATLSRIINSKQEHYSQEIVNKIHAYLDAINTNDKNLLK